MKSSDPNDLDVALLRFQQERYEDSNAILFELYDEASADSFGAFCIGRNFLYVRDLANAERWLRISAQREPVFRWVYYELARFLEVRGQIFDAAIELKNFCEKCSGDLAEVALNDTHISVISRIAHLCFDIDRSSVMPIYQFLYAIGHREYLVELRIVELLLEVDRIAEAGTRLLDMEQRYSLDAWGFFAKARWLFACGRSQEILSTLHSAAAVEPENPNLKAIVAHRLLEFNLFAECQAYLRDVLSPIAEQVPSVRQAETEIGFRVAIKQANHQEIIRTCESADIKHVSNWILAEGLFRFALPGEQITPDDLKAASALAKVIESHESFTLGSALSLHQFYSRRRLWDELIRLDARTAQVGLFDHPEVVMRRFEAICAQAKLDEAAEMYRRYYQGRHLGQWEACVVMRFLAEAKMWGDANELMRQFLEDGFYFPDGDFFLCRICRKNDSHLTMISAIDSHPKEMIHSDLLRLRQTLVDDLELRRLPADKDASSYISAKNFLLVKPALISGENRNAIYFCTDRAYFLSVLTLISSLSTYASRSLGVDWYIFIDKGVPDDWSVRATEFAAKLGIGLSIVQESGIVDEDAVHVENYGIFTGGNTLSRAAFLRIYAARYLLNTGRYRRALYLDSDIVANGSVADLIDHDFERMALLARAEETSPEVEAAANAHGMRAADYFNSGVLLFDLASDRMEGYLARAIDLSEKHPDRLLFHDQCALNIAFNGSTRLISEEWNFFLRPYRPDNGDIRLGKLLHFLDKPKPWDVSYFREYRSLWLPHLQQVRSILSASHYHELVLAANS